MRVVETADNTQTQNRQDGNRIRVYGKRATTQLVGERCREYHRDNLHAGQDYGDQERVIVSGILDLVPGVSDVDSVDSGKWHVQK